MISFVYFDVGGVLVDDFSGNNKWSEMKKDLGVKAEDDKEFDDSYDEYEKEVCVGRNVDALLPLIKERFKLTIPDNYSLQERFIRGFEKNGLILPIVKEVKKNCRTGLLTNMYPGMLLKLHEREIMPKEKWDVIIDSAVEKCRKPDLAIFKLAEERSNAKKDNILFVDNSARNIETALGFGWKTFLYDSSNHKKSCSDLLNYYNEIK